MSAEQPNFFKMFNTYGEESQILPNYCYFSRVISQRVIYTSINLYHVYMPNNKCIIIIIFFAELMHFVNGKWYLKNHTILNMFESNKIRNLNVQRSVRFFRVITAIIIIFFLTSIKIIQYDDIFNLLDTLLFKHPQRMPESIRFTVNAIRI